MGERDFYYFNAGDGYHPKQIIEAMLDNVDILLVDPALFPEIERLLSDYLIEAKERNDTVAIAKLEFFIKYISEEPQRQAIAKILERPVKEPVIKPPALSESELEDEIKRIWDTRKIRNYTEPELDLVVARMRQKTADFIASGDYLNAQRADHFAKILISHGQLGTVKTMQKQKVNEIEQKLNESRRELDQNKAKWEELHINMRQAALDDLDKMRRDHRKEIEDLEQLKDQDPPPHIKKYSNALLQLRRREQALIQSRQFQSAGEMKAIADDMQREEDEQQRNKWIEEINVKIANARKTQANQVRVRKAYWRNEEKMLVSEANKDITQAEKAIAHLEMNLKIAEQAKDIAANLKRETKNVVQEQPKSRGLPLLGDVARTPQKQSADFRQRQILTKKIYTRTPKSQCITPRERKKIMKRL